MTCIFSHFIAPEAFLCCYRRQRKASVSSAKPGGLQPFFVLVLRTNKEPFPASRHPCPFYPTGDFINWYMFLKDVITHMEAGHEFSIEVITADRNKNTGGDILYFPKAKIFRKKKQGFDGKTGLTKRQNHFINSTRNLLLPNNQIRKIHIRLITRFNGETVVY